MPTPPNNSRKHNNAIQHKPSPIAILSTEQLSSTEEDPLNGCSCSPPPTPQNDKIDCKGSIAVVPAELDLVIRDLPPLQADGGRNSNGTTSIVGSGGGDDDHDDASSPSCDLEERHPSVVVGGLAAAQQPSSPPFATMTMASSTTATTTKAKAAAAAETTTTSCAGNQDAHQIYTLSHARTAPTVSTGTRALPAAVVKWTMDEVVERIGFGKFHRHLIWLCGVGYFAEITELVVVGFVSPSIQRQWGLADWQYGLLGSSSFIGMAVGALFWGYVSDHHGRQVSFKLTVWLTFAGGFLSAFSPSYWILLFLRLVGAFGIGGMLPVDYTVFLEFLPRDNRGAHIVMVDAVGIVPALALSATIAWYFSSGDPSNSTAISPAQDVQWRWILLLSSIPVGIMAFLRRHVPESPRYYLSRGQVDRAQEIINHVAVQNDVLLPPQWRLVEARTTRHADDSCATSLTNAAAHMVAGGCINPRSGKGRNHSPPEGGRFAPAISSLNTYELAVETDLNHSHDHDNDDDDHERSSSLCDRQRLRHLRHERDHPRERRYHYEAVAEHGDSSEQQQLQITAGVYPSNLHSIQLSRYQQHGDGTEYKSPTTAAPDDFIPASNRSEDILDALDAVAGEDSQANVQHIAAAGDAYCASGPSWRGASVAGKPTPNSGTWLTSHDIPMDRRAAAAAAGDGHSSHSFAELLSPSLRKLSLCLWMVCFCLQFASAGMVFALPKLFENAMEQNNLAGRYSERDIAKDLLVGVVGVVPGLTIAYVAVERSRTKSLAGFLLAAGLSVFGLTAALHLTATSPSSHLSAAIWFSALLRGAMEGCFAILGTTAVESYPTVLRASGLGTAHIFDHIAGSISPIVFGMWNSHAAATAEDGHSSLGVFFMQYGALSLYALSYLIAVVPALHLPDYAGRACPDDLYHDDL